MAEYRLGAVEAQFADIIWDNAPMQSGALVKLCEAKLEWKKSTTYTVLRRLCDRGIFKNENGVISPLMTREEFYSKQSEEFVNESFSGSLPRFLAAFTNRVKLTDKEIDELQQLIDAHRGER